MTIRGLEVEEIYDGDDFIWDIKIHNPLNWKGKKCYGIRDALIDDMWARGVKKFIIDGHTFETPNKTYLKDMKRNGFVGELPSKFNNAPNMKMYYFEIT